MNNHELLEVLLEEFSKHTSLDLVIKTEIATEFGKICGYDRICDRADCMIFIMIVEGSLIVHANLYKSFSFSATTIIPLYDPEMFNRTIAIIKKLENSKQLKTNK